MPATVQTHTGRNSIGKQIPVLKGLRIGRSKSNRVEGNGKGRWQLFFHKGLSGHQGGRAISELGLESLRE